MSEMSHINAHKTVQTYIVTQLMEMGDWEQIMKHKSQTRQNFGKFGLKMSKYFIFTFVYLIYE